MICPYCVEDVPANSQRHDACRIIRDKQFPLFYVDHHGGEGTTEPVILSVVGFPGHGKTVFLCSLFDYLDNQLTQIWRSFFNQVLDQESLSRLNENRLQLRRGILPPPTQQSFPRPGIFRLTHMPRYAAVNGLPPLDDTTVLIYDPPGEAFVTEEKIVQFASFVKRSSCVLFLVDITALGDSIADQMAVLLDTYVLGMRRMGIEKESQHLIVVYTKSDEMKVSVPEFVNYVEKEPKLKDYLNEQRPETLANPHVHLTRLEYISQLLETFTRAELNAGKFIHVADDWFASVSYTVVSSLGAAPEQGQNENGEFEMRLTVRMAPRCVADPLLYVLAKSIKIKEVPPQLPPPFLPLWAVMAIIGSVVALIIILVFLLFSGSEGKPQSTFNGSPSTGASPRTAATPSKPPAPPPGMTYVHGGEFTMGRADGDVYERPPHSVTVRPFFIDLYEVTCEEYAHFVKEKGRAPPSNWVGGECPRGTARQPITGVTWDDAVAYAMWAGKRLPTEEEWEFAAHGSDRRRYPWGNEWKAGMANAGGDSGKGLVDVGTFRGVSPIGAYDMIGNAWEWTASDLKAYPGGQLPFAPTGDLKVIRGGSWKEGPEEATVTYRGHLPARGSKDYSATGFRCAQTVTTASASSENSYGKARSLFSISM